MGLAGRTGEGFSATASELQSGFEMRVKKNPIAGLIDIRKRLKSIESVERMGFC